MSLPHNEQELGKPLRTRKKRGAVFIVIVVSIVVHVLGLGGLAAIKIIEVLQPEAEFEAPPVVVATPPPPPPPPPPTNKRAQRSMPRPQALAVQNPQNMSVPSIEIDDSNLTIGGGRGFGGGLGDLGGAVADSLRISFFGMESSGGNVAILFDCSHSAARVFDLTRSELFKTMDQMEGAAEAQFALIYFGGSEGGMRGIGWDKNPTRSDFWYPKGVRKGEWLTGQSPDLAKIRKVLDGIENPEAAKAKTYDQVKKDDKKFFVLGTNYFGALNEAYGLKPAPDTVYLIVEPEVAFKNMETAKKSFEAWEKKGGRKRPENTKLVFVVCSSKFKKDSGTYQATAYMLNQFHGGSLTPEQIDEQIVISERAGAGGGNELSSKKKSSKKKSSKKEE
jgi:hypothetical protein